MSTTPLLEEIEGLLAQMPEENADSSHLMPHPRTLADALRRARNQFIALEQDGERLDWLEKNRGSVVWAMGTHHQSAFAGTPKMDYKEGDTVRAAIDQARRADGGGKP